MLQLTFCHFTDENTWNILRKQHIQGKREQLYDRLTWPPLYLLHTGLQQVSQLLHQLSEGRPILGLPLPAVQHGLVSKDRGRYERSSPRTVAAVIWIIIDLPLSNILHVPLFCATGLPFPSPRCVGVSVLIVSFCSPWVDLREATGVFVSLTSCQHLCPCWKNPQSFQSSFFSPFEWNLKKKCCGCLYAVWWCIPGQDQAAMDSYPAHFPTDAATDLFVWWVKEATNKAAGLIFLGWRVIGVNRHKNPAAHMRGSENHRPTHT